jgi:hypothetical protein
MKLMNLGEITLAHASPMLPSVTCVPTNDLLTGPFSGPLNSLTGALGGLMQLLVILVIVLAVVLIIATALFRNSSARYMQAIALVVGAFVGLPLLISIVVVIRGMFNNMC